MSSTSSLPAPQRRSRFLLAAAGSALAFTGFLGGLIYAHTYAGDTQTSAPGPTPAVNLCASTEEAVRERMKLIFVDPDFQRAEPMQVSDGTATWCVLGLEKGQGMYWGIVYVGHDNPLYRTMVADSGDSPDVPRAMITYPDSPPVQFAHNGWIGFMAPSDGETWTELRTGAATLLLSDLAQKAR